MVNRIFSFIESQQLTPTEFADKIGVSRASISSIKTGRTQPTLSLVEKIRQHFPDIDINWLIFGVGSAMVEKSETATKEVGLSDELMVVEDNNDSVLSSVANDYEAVYIADAGIETHGFASLRFRWFFSFYYKENRQTSSPAVLAQ